jgi:hypothetical protein
VTSRALIYFVVVKLNNVAMDGNNNRLVTIPLHHTWIGAPIAVAPPISFPEPAILGKEREALG